MPSNQANYYNQSVFENISIDNKKIKVRIYLKEYIFILEFQYKDDYFSQEMPKLPSETHSFHGDDIYFEGIDSLILHMDKDLLAKRMNKILDEIFN